jgi:polygalacturonase
MRHDAFGIIPFLLLAFGILINGCAHNASLTRSRPSEFNVASFGAIADGSASTTKRLQAAIDAAASAGGGTVFVPAGTYVTGTLWMKSNVTLYIDAGATLLGSKDKAEFPEWISEWEGPGVPREFRRYAPLFAGEKLENVALVGRGTIDARGEMWWDMQRAEKKASGSEMMRPRTFRLVNSRNILIEGLTFKRSPYWTLSPLACENVTISKVTIINPPDSPNTDGINPESCRNVRISDCHVDVGDDCITIKSGKESDGRRELWPCENITITNCTLVHGHGGVVFGSEMSGSVRNVTISNCVFVGTDRGLRFKARRGRGGVVEDIRANNLVMDGVLCPIAVNLFYGPGAWKDKKVTDQSAFPVDAGTPRFRRLRFSNITARNVKYAAAFMIGLPEMHIEDVAFDNVSFYVDPTNTEAGDPDMAPGVPKLSRAGIVAQRVDRLSLRNVEITDQLGAAVKVQEARDLVMNDLTLRTPHDKALVELVDVNSASIRGVSVPHDSAVALRLAGAQTAGIRIGANDWSSSKKAIELEAAVKPDAMTLTAGATSRADSAD